MEWKAPIRWREWLPSHVRDAKGHASGIPVVESADHRGYPAKSLAGSFLARPAHELRTQADAENRAVTRECIVKPRSPAVCLKGPGGFREVADAGEDDRAVSSNSLSGLSDGRGPQSDATEQHLN
jgi:hypothetical protein